MELDKDKDSEKYTDSLAQLLQSNRLKKIKDPFSIDVGLVTNCFQTKLDDINIDSDWNPQEEDEHVLLKNTEYT